MVERKKGRDVIAVNRAPVLTLWAAVVAERLGFDRREALTLGRAVAGLNAYSKGVALGLFKPSPDNVAEKRSKLRASETVAVDLLGRAVPAVRTGEGLRAVSKDKPVSPDSVERYLQSKFGDSLDEVKGAMTALARSFDAAGLASRAYALYEKFRPQVPAGKKGWGAAGELDLGRIRRMGE